MNQKRKIEFTGLIVFLFSVSLYVLTLEPTTSFWDCSEFILSAAKLEVNHPAGAPLFMLLGRVFALLAGNNVEKIAWFINLLSGVFSALTLFFLFHASVKIMSCFIENITVVIGSAAMGALTFAVSDSFWFSAVEGEVYGLSMFILTLSLWAILKWNEGFGKEGNDRWILLLSLITGLGLGVHLLNLLIIPSVVMIFGFKKYGYSKINLVLFSVVGIGVLLGILYALTPMVMKTLAWFDFIFVNHLNFPKHVGALFGIAGILALFVFLLLYSSKKEKKLAELTILSILMLLIGFSVYSVNSIRSSANPPVNFGRPDNLFSLIDYLNREQYPKRPLVYGQGYNSTIIGINERETKRYIDGKYKITELPATYEYDKKTCSWFPRMYSREEAHIQAYNNWVNIRGKRIAVNRNSGTQESIIVPRFRDHLSFFVKYQFGYMFGRYFMWNFVGRQNDRQGRGDLLNGNWLSGIEAIDSMRLGPQEQVPDWLKNNKGRNTYFFLPLLIGLFGGWFHYKNHRETFFVILALFVMGGLGLTVYINEIPITPRERDYVFVGAFMAFSVWVGAGFAALADFSRQHLKTTKLNWAAFGLLLLLVPGLMLVENYDDHNRSGRFAARDFAVNILESCPPNAILFTSGDNDTYPLLYCQEVEGVRTDVRIVIMPFLSSNWFIDGLRKDKYHDAGLKMTLDQRKYDYGELDYVPIVDKLKREATWVDAFSFLQMDEEKAKVTMSSGEKVNFIPLTQIKFSIGANENTGTIPVSLKGEKILYKHQLAMWDIISSNATERPICFASKAEATKHGLENYLCCLGFAYQLTPGKQNSEDFFSIGEFDAELLYSKLTNEFNWGNIEDTLVYADWNTVVNSSIFQVRNVFNQVAEALLKSGEKEKAAALLIMATKKFPLRQLPHDIYCFQQAKLLVESNAGEVSQEWFSSLERNVLQTLQFYERLTQKQRGHFNHEIQRELMFLNNLYAIALKMKNETKAEMLRSELNRFMQMIS